MTEGELKKRITAIYRSARTSLEENGANTLFLALGFMEWYESESSEIPRMAPLILVPIEIQRRSVLEGFEINQGDDDTIINVTLLEMLFKDFNISISGLDPIPLDDHGVDVPLILDKFRQAVKKIKRWRVREEAFIGQFSFSKYLMWRDLEVRSEELQKNKVVNHLINEPQKAYAYGGTFPNPNNLDKTHHLTSSFCPLSADSSQLAAIYAAAGGKSFVLQGPPGTGKSQTITNLIANALGNGRKVLFVAEKMAALSVVHNRLKDCGLNVFCLEIHSNKSRKKDVIQQLGRSLTLNSDVTSEEWKFKAEKLEEIRNELNQYVDKLHLTRNCGESVFQGISKLTSLKKEKRVTIHIDDIQNVSREDLYSLRELLAKMEIALERCGNPRDNVWSCVSKSDWSIDWRNQLKEAFEIFQRGAIVLQTISEEVGELLGLGGDGWSMSDLYQMGQVSLHLVNAPIPTRAMIETSNWTRLKSDAKNWAEHGIKYKELQGEMFKDYEKSIFDLDLKKLFKDLRSAEEAWFIPKWFGRWMVSRELQKNSKPGKKIDKDRMLDDLQRAISLNDEGSFLANISERAFHTLDHLWRKEETDWDKISETLDWVEKLREMSRKSAGTDFSESHNLFSRWGVMSIEGNTQLDSDGPIGKKLIDYAQAYNAFIEAKEELGLLLGVDTTPIWDSGPKEGLFDRIISQVDVWNESINNLHDWCYWVKVREQARSTGLEEIVEGVDSGEIQPGELKQVFERSFYQKWVETIIDSEPALQKFYSPDFEKKIQDFRKLDHEFTLVTRDEIKSKLSNDIPSPGNASLSKNSEMGILFREIQKKRGHLSIRKLFEKVPNLLPLLKPCLLMSPMSVAQYLDPSFPQFDLVVFDEASQIPTWDAVGAIARGKEVVVVGDPKQLPPTNFFNRIDDTDDEEDFLADLESILDDCLAAQLPRMDLRWHYRSKREDLIAFSNYYYYDNRLNTFPPPTQQRGVSLRKIDGIYDKGKSRTNRAEAKAIVREILGRLNDDELSNYTIGVVTFSQSQQTLIEDLLDEARRRDNSLEKFFTEETSEPVFVKNLENVQGDERDIILFSICYGPDRQGRVSMNFGPINRDGGERRLNVAVTRARREVIVFSSITSDKIDLARTRARGVADLKCFLDYAERGVVAIHERTTFSSTAECESPFEQQVYNELVNRGYIVHTQVGCSGYRIDLAIVDPGKPGSYILGIECDGANYHRAKVARDRDILREGVLRSLGWELHRIWSSDWWERPDKEMEKLEQAISDAKMESLELSLEEIQQDRKEVTTEKRDDSQKECEKKKIEDIRKELDSLVNSNGSSDVIFPVYKVYNDDFIYGTGDQFYSAAADKHIQRIIKEIILLEGPVGLKLLCSRILKHYQLNRITKRVWKRIKSLCVMLGLNKTRCEYETFYWPESIPPDKYDKFRIPGEDSITSRDALDIPPREIKNAAKHIMKSSISIPYDDLVRETSKLLGFGRTGKKVEKAMKTGIELLSKEDCFEINDGIITLRQ